MTNAQLELVKLLPLLFLPLSAWLIWLAWRSRWRSFGILLAACLIAALAISFGPFIGKQGHGVGWEGLAAFIYFGIFLSEYFSTALVGGILALIQRRQAKRSEQPRTCDPRRHQCLRTELGTPSRSGFQHHCSAGLFLLTLLPVPRLFWPGS